MRIFAGDVNSHLIEAVFLNGERQEDVVGFDDEKCWVEYYKRDESGNFVIGSDDDLVRERKYGIVTLAWKEMK